MEGVVSRKSVHEAESQWEDNVNYEINENVPLSIAERRVLEHQEEDFDKLIRATSDLDAKEIQHLRNLFYFVSSSCGKVPLRHKRTIEAKQAQFTLRQCGFDAPPLNDDAGTLDIEGLGSFGRLTVRTFLQIAGLLSVERSDRIHQSIFNRGKERANALFRMIDPAGTGKATPEDLLHFLCITGVKGHTMDDAKMFCAAVSKINENYFTAEDLLWYIERRGAILRYDSSNESLGLPP